MTPSDDPVVASRKDGVAEIVLNRPARRNAVTGPLAKRLHEEIVAATEDDEVAVLLIRGAGGAFCSGLDLGEFRADPPPDWMPDFSGLWLDVHSALYDCPKPIVVALERFAINAGSALALAADLLVAGEQAFLHVGEIQMGMAAPMNMAWLRLRHPESVAARLAIVGSSLRGTGACGNGRGDRSRGRRRRARPGSGTFRDDRRLSTERRPGNQVHRHPRPAGRVRSRVVRAASRRLRVTDAPQLRTSRGQGRPRSKDGQRPPGRGRIGD